MRLKSGRLWYTPGVGESGAFEKWASLCGSLFEGKVTPVIGPGMLESLVGPFREIALRWADEYGFPFAAHERGDLARVAQFLATQQDLLFPYNALARALRGELLRRYDALLPESFKRPLPPPNLDSMLETVAAARPSADNPYSILARLDAPVFITTCFDNLLVAALKAEGKDPVVAICPWNDDLAQTETGLEESRPGYYPSPERPLVYHLFWPLR